MWLLTAWRSIAGTQRSIHLYCSSSLKWRSNCVISQNSACHHLLSSHVCIAGKHKRCRSLSLNKHFQDPFTVLYGSQNTRSIYASCLPGLSILSLSTSSRGNDTGFSLLQSHCNIFRNPSLAFIHTSSHKRDIPNYLQGYISEVTSIEDDLEEDIGDDFDNDMEDEILEFLNSRLIPYEEAESSFTVPCHSCSTEEQGSHSQEIFVDKNSGYFVCPWCCQAGTWEELTRMLDSREDCLTPHQLSTYLATTSQISEVHISNFQESPLQAVSLTTLQDCDARITSDGTRVIFPLKSESGNIVGFESVSLLYPIPQIVRRYVVEEKAPLCILENLRNRKRIVVVPNLCDVLTLAEYKIPAVAFPASALDVLCDFLTSNDKREVLVWLGVEPPPRPLLQSLVSSQISSWIVKCDDNDSPIHTKTLSEVQVALRNIDPVVSESTITFSELRNEIYRRLINKEETCGIQWKRFAELNNILLGHRPGEMTVLTGPTGSGKTTLMAEYSLDLCSQGVVTLWGSFEISIVRLCEVMLQQFSGTSLPVDLNDFNVLASKFSSLPLHFLTYHGQQTTNSVLKAMSEAVRVWGVQHVIIDNLQFMLGTSEKAIDRWWEQDKAVAAFRRFATLNNCHVTLIVHPKKIPEGQLLSIGSIFGGAKVAQEADNVLILQVKESSTVNQNKKALQVVKNRYGGQLGVLPMKFHKESLTLSSCFLQKSKVDKDKLAQPQKNQSAKQVKGLKALMN